MPRPSTTTTTAPLGDTDEQGLERLPDFGDPTKTHDQVLADLDQRDARLNGTAQSELPGTPEPDHTNDLEIPGENAFTGKDFVSAPGLKALGQWLIAQHENLSLLRGVEVRYLWKRRGGTSGGNPKLGYLQRPGGLLRYYTGGVQFIAVLAADHCRELSREQIEANLFHQLLHADTSPDDDDAYRIRGHSFEGFVEELDAYGPWSADLKELAAHVQQLTPLEQAIADADEGQESE